MGFFMDFLQKKCHWEQNFTYGYWITYVRVQDYVHLTVLRKAKPLKKTHQTRLITTQSNTQLALLRDKKKVSACLIFHTIFVFNVCLRKGFVSVKTGGPENLGAQTTVRVSQWASARYGSVDSKTQAITHRLFPLQTIARFSSQTSLPCCCPVRFLPTPHSVLCLGFTIS